MEHTTTGLSSIPKVSDSHGQWFRLRFGHRRSALVAHLPRVGGMSRPRLLLEKNGTDPRHMRAGLLGWLFINYTLCKTGKK